MRPATIVWFERLICATLLLGLVQTFLFPNDAGFGADGMMANLIAAALVLAVMLRISRWRSKLAMRFAILWSVIALPVVVVTSLPLALHAAAEGKLLGWAWLSMGHAALQLIACGLLLTPSARRWINREPTLADLGETFA